MKRSFVLFLLSLIVGTNTLYAQVVIFTARNTSDEHEFWKVNVSTPLVYQKISDDINSKVLYPGKNKGPISISHTGDYYIFQSERFDNNIDGYEAITICKSDFSSFEVPKDPGGAAYHAEGIMQISNDGRTIIFEKGDGTHTRDIYKITKGASSWSYPSELTTSANTYSYYMSPYLSYDETKIMFEASNSTYPSLSIGEMKLDGTGLRTVISTADISGSSEIKSPAYDVSGNVYFEAATDGERIWTIAAGSSTPAMVKSSFTNDNSPITLPNGNIASLYESSTHQIKIMDANGANDFMLTASSASFNDIEDIGISASGGAIATSQNETLKNEVGIYVYPNPNIGTFELIFEAQNNSEYQIEISNAIGQLLIKENMKDLTGKHARTFDLAPYGKGLYLITLSNNGYKKMGKVIVN